MYLHLPDLLRERRSLERCLARLLYSSYIVKHVTKER